MGRYRIVVSFGIFTAVDYNAAFDSREIILRRYFQGENIRVYRHGRWRYHLRLWPDFNTVFDGNLRHIEREINIGIEKPRPAPAKLPLNRGDSAIDNTLQTARIFDIHIAPSRLVLTVPTVDPGGYLTGEIIVKTTLITHILEEIPQVVIAPEAQMTVIAGRIPLQAVIDNNRIALRLEGGRLICKGRRIEE